MTILWSFSYNSFVKFHGQKIWEPQHDRVISKSVYNEACYKGNALYYTTLTLFQAVGISLETRRIDIFEKAILESVSI